MQEQITLTEAFAAGALLAVMLLAPLALLSLEPKDTPATVEAGVAPPPIQCSPSRECTDAELNGLSMPIDYSYSITQSGYGIKEPRTRYHGKAAP